MEALLIIGRILFSLIFLGPARKRGLGGVKSLEWG